MDAASTRDRIFFEVPLSPSSLQQLHHIAAQENTTPLRVLRGIVEGYRRNGRPPAPTSTQEEHIHRGVPLTHALLRDLNEMAAQYKVPPLTLLQGILEEELRRRAVVAPSVAT